MDANSKLQLALIGAGRIGRIHGRNAAFHVPEARLVAIADVNREAAEALAAELEVGDVVEDYRDLLARQDVDAVLVCSATDTHAEISQQAAAAGKHIFCEKPIDFDLGRIDAVLEAVERAGVKFQVGFNRRFDPTFRRVREMVAEGKVGRPEILRITSRDPAPPPLDYIRASGGIFFDMTIHDFDMARFLIGSEVEEVFAQGGVMVDPAIGQAGDLDTAVVLLRFANGVLGTIDNSRRAVYGYDQRVEVFGSQGMVAAENETPDRHVFADGQGVHRALPLYFFLERYAQAYLDELKAFVRCVLDDTPPPVTGADGRAPVVLAMAATRSVREGRPVLVRDLL